MEAARDLRRQRRLLNDAASAEAFAQGPEWDALCSRIPDLLGAGLTKAVDKELLRENLSLLANVLHLSKSTLPHSDLFKRKAVFVTLGQILSSRSIGPGLKTAAARVVGNLAARKESGGHLVQQTEILQSLVEGLSSGSWEAKARAQALRCFRLLALSGRSFLGALLRLELPAALAAVATDEAEGSLEEALSPLATLARYRVLELGTQLARTAFAPVLLRLRFTGRPRLCLLRTLFDALLENSSEMRSALAGAGLLETLIATINDIKAGQVSEGELEATGLQFFNCIRYLASLAHDSCCRARIKESGAISLFVEAFATTDFGSTDHANFASYFCRFIHDTHSLEYFLFCEAFLGTIARDLDAWTDSNPRVCADEEPAEFRADSPTYVRLQKESRVQVEPERAGPMDWDGRGAGGVFHQPSPPYSPPRGTCWSPGASSTSFASTVSPPPSQAHSPLQSDEESGPETPTTRKRTAPHGSDDTPPKSPEAATVETEMRLMAWFSHTESLYLRMDQEKFVKALIRYMGSSATPSPKGIRALTRICTAPQLLEDLIRYRIHVVLWDETSRVRCGAKQRTCSACADVVTMGDSVLRHLGAALSSSYGVGILTQHMATTDDGRRRLGATVAFGLLQGRVPRRRLLAADGGLDLIMAGLLVGESESAQCVALWTRNERLFSSSRMATGGPCHLIQYPIQDAVEVVEFVRLDGSTIALPLALLCDGSAYFRGLFSGAFADSGARLLRLEEMAEPATVVEAFLHFQAGCRGCPALGGRGDWAAEEVMALLEMADAHLCRPLSSWLVESVVGGLADAGTAPAFAAVALRLDQPRLLRPAFLFLFRRLHDFHFPHFLQSLADHQLQELFATRLREFLVSFV